MICKPEGWTDDDVLTGLLANLPRIYAMEMLRMKRAISLAFNPKDHGFDLAAALGLPKDEMGAAQSEAAAWREERRDSFLKRM